MLEAKNLSKRFFRKREDSNVFYPVKDVNLALEPGKLTILSGPSGSGKSTLMNMFCGILEPTEGTVLFDDKNIYEMDDKALSRFRNEHFGVIPQNQSGLNSLTVLENVMLPYTLYKNDSAAEKAKALLEKTGIADLKNIMPSELSGGELRRMAIARALICDPDVVFADEPTADLDEENTKIVMELFKDIAKSGKTVFVVTHDKDAMSYGDVKIEMEKGELK